MTGILSLQDVERENAFDDADVRLLQGLAASMRGALENARLWDQDTLYPKALERQFEIGREIQAGFLPDALAQPAGWEIAASLTSARKVAGDFYDVFELPEGKIGVVIADVCDKGLGIPPGACQPEREGVRLGKSGHSMCVWPRRGLRAARRRPGAGRSPFSDARFAGGESLTHASG